MKILVVMRIDKVLETLELEESENEICLYKGAGYYISPRPFGCGVWLLLPDYPNTGNVGITQEIKYMTPHQRSIRSGMIPEISPTHLLCWVTFKLFYASGIEMHTDGKILERNVACEIWQDLASAV